MAKNIVVCCDGTGNQLGANATNVLRLWSALVRDQSQVCFYDPGVGTLGDPRVLGVWRRQLRKRLDGAIGYSIRDNFIDAYSFIARRYTDGDRIFLFGFSRGAYTARAVAGAIHLFGLLEPAHENLAPYVWRTYSNDDGDEDADDLFGTAARFRKRFTRTVPIHFVGVWDTVSSFGLITNFRTLPHTRSNPSVAVLRHAAAIDERRACFRCSRCDPTVPGQDTKEVWFAGVHSDVGGGYPEKEAGLAKIPLRWMLGEAGAHGLALDPARVAEALADPPPDPAARAHESLAGWWRLLEFLPQRRWTHGKKKFGWCAPNFFAPRRMTDDEVRAPLVHDSVRARRAQTGYSPKNFPPQVMWVADQPGV